MYQPPYPTVPYQQYFNAYPTIHYQQPPSAANGYGWHGNGYGWQLDPKSWQTAPLYPTVNDQVVEEPAIQVEKVSKQDAWGQMTCCFYSCYPCCSPCCTPCCTPCCSPCCSPCYPCTPCTPCRPCEPCPRTGKITDGMGGGMPGDDDDGPVRVMQRPMGRKPKKKKEPEPVCTPRAVCNCPKPKPQPPPCCCTPKSTGQNASYGGYGGGGQPMNGGGGQPMSGGNQCRTCGMPKPSTGYGDTQAMEACGTCGMQKKSGYTVCGTCGCLKSANSSPPPSASPYSASPYQQFGGAQQYQMPQMPQMPGYGGMSGGDPYGGGQYDPGMDYPSSPEPRRSCCKSSKKSKRKGNMEAICLMSPLDMFI